MNAACAASAPPVANRSSGIVRLAFARRDARTVMREGFQSGCLRAHLPRVVPGAAELVLMNTAGGLADGDRLDQALHWEEETDLAVTTQSAEKVYRATGDGAVVRTLIRIDRGATAEWLPQETILFDAARLTRDLSVEMAEDAIFVGVEMVVLGRAAMGETVLQGRLIDRWRVRRGGRLIYADVLRIEDDVAGRMARPALGGGATAFATILCVARDAAQRLDGVRAMLVAPQGAASSWHGLLAIRVVAADGADLRRMVVPALAALRGGRMLPRSWSC